MAAYTSSLTLAGLLNKYRACVSPADPAAARHRNSGSGAEDPCRAPAMTAALLSTRHLFPCSSRKWERGGNSPDAIYSSSSSRSRKAWNLGCFACPDDHV